MIQEERYILLRDLCARLLYGVKVWHLGVTRELLGIIPSTENVMVGYDINDYEDSVIEDIKPYLRPMSSMTDDEKMEIYNWLVENDIEWSDFIKLRLDEILISFDSSWLLVNWLNKHHFDYRGLIEKGLALEAPDNMYKHFGDMDVVVTSIEYKHKL